jgi:hypothetical protein
MVAPHIGFTIKAQEIIIQIVRNEMTLEEASKIYTDLSIKYLDCIAFTPEEDILWKEVCEIVFSDLRVKNPDMFIDVKKSARENPHQIKKMKQDLETDIKNMSDNINRLNKQIKISQDKLKQLELENWQPDDGNFVVETTGNIFDRKQWPQYDVTAMHSENNFGSVRTTQKRAEMASDNMRRFNRLSCYMGDLRPVLEFSKFSVGLNFYDYDSNKIETLKKILDSKGDL